MPKLIWEEWPAEMLGSQAAALQDAAQALNSAVADLNKIGADATMWVSGADYMREAVKTVMSFADRVKKSRAGVSPKRDTVPQNTAKTSNGRTRQRPAKTPQTKKK